MKIAEIKEMTTADLAERIHAPESCSITLGKQCTD